MRDVRDLSPYVAVIAGSAIHAGKWLPEAMQFVEQHRSALSTKPLALFLVCMTLAMPKAAQYRAFVTDFFAPVRALVTPVSEGCFAGTLDISKVPSFADRLKFRLSVLFGVWSEGDHRDWEAIRAWAQSLRPLLAG
jgi:menaquinone-dependent protoporphyrinogen oxidase